MSLASAAARGALVTLLGQWLKFLLLLISTAVLARLLDPADFGLLTMVTAVSGVALLIADFGLSTASIQKQAVTEREKSNLFWLNALLGAGLSVGLFFASGPISDFYGIDEVQPIMQVLSFVIILSSIAAQSKAELSRSLRFRDLAVVDVLSQGAGVVVAISLAATGWGVWALVWQQLAVAASQCVGFLVLARWRPGLPGRTSTMKPLLSFGLNSLGTQLLNYASNNADSVVVGKVLGADALGVYSRAFQLFRMPMQQLAAPMTRVAFPVLSKLVGTPAYDAYIARAQLLLTYGLGGVFFAAAAVADPLIDLYLGPGWEGVKPVFYILSIGGVFQAVSYVYYWIFLSKAMTGIQLRFTVISRPIMVLLTLTGVIWGVVGVAAGFTLGLIFNWLLLTFFAIPRTGVDIRQLLRATVRPLLLYGVMLAILFPVSAIGSTWGSPLLQMGLLVAVALAYVGVVQLVVRPVHADLALVISTLKLMTKRRG